MFHIISEETYPDGSIIVEEGSSGDWIYTILSGKVEIFKIINGHEVIVDVVEQGDVLGETSFLSQMKRSASARAVGEVTVGIIDRDYLDEEFNKLSGDFKKILTTLANRLKKTTEAACTLADRRSCPRTKQAAGPRLKIVFKKEDSKIRAYADISSEGIFITTDEVLEEGEQFRFRLEIPGRPDPVKGTCEVIWSRKSSDAQASRPNGMGCKFIKVNRENRTALKTFLAEARQEGP